MFSTLMDGLRSIVVRGFSLEDRRAELRAERSLPVQGTQDGQEQEGRILNLSVHGLRLVTAVALSTQAPVQVGHPGGQALSYRVRWCQRQAQEVHHGLCLVEGAALEGSWLEPLLSTLGLDGRQRRKYLRARAAIPVKLLGRANRVWAEGATVDLGMGGTMVKVSASVKPQTTVAVHLGPFGRLKPVQVLGRVLEVREIEGAFLHRIEFRELSAEQARPLGTYVLQALKK